MLSYVVCTPNDTASSREFLSFHPQRQGTEDDPVLVEGRGGRLGGGCMESRLEGVDAGADLSSFLSDISGGEVAELVVAGDAEPSQILERLFGSRISATHFPHFLMRIPLYGFSCWLCRLCFLFSAAAPPDPSIAGKSRIYFFSSDKLIRGREKGVYV
nr:hypothetical protein Iba_chr14cCG12420 [Ipomoea batatas]